MFTPTNFVFGVLLLTLILFIWGKLRADLVAVISMLSLFAGGILDTSQLLSGFGNSTVIMIAALFVVGEGLSRTGVTSWMSLRIIEFAGNKPRRITIVVMLGTALLSAFISNTGTVATLLPAVIAVAWSVESFPSKLLIPLAFAANCGGLLTLTGTPPNIVVNSSLVEAGFAPLGFFEFGYIGLPLLVVAVVYMALFANRLLPESASGEKPEDLDSSVQHFAGSYELEGKFNRVKVAEGSVLADHSLRELALGKEFGVTVIDVTRDENIAHGLKYTKQLASLAVSHKNGLPGPDTVLHAGDTLLLKGSVSSLARICEAFNLTAEKIEVSGNTLRKMTMSKDTGMAEMLITPRSRYIGKTLKESGLNKQYGIQVISVLRRGELVPLNSCILQFGDAVLFRGRWQDIEVLSRDRANFTIVGRPDDMFRQVVELNWKALIAVGALVGMVVLMVLGTVPTVIAALLAAIVMVLGGCLDMGQAYRSVGWQSVVLIAAMIPLSLALDSTGGAKLIAETLVASVGTYGPLALLAGIFLLTSFFSQIINNTATAILMAPIVLQAALVAEVSPYPFMLAVSISASTAFLTPIGTTTNLMVMTPGGYAFRDYLKVGAPLVLVFFAASLVLLPLIWPF